MLIFFSWCEKLKTDTKNSRRWKFVLCESKKKFQFQNSVKQKKDYSVVLYLEWIEKQTTTITRLVKFVRIFYAKFLMVDFFFFFQNTKISVPILKMKTNYKTLSKLPTQKLFEGRFCVEKKIYEIKFWKRKPIYLYSEIEGKLEKRDQSLKMRRFRAIFIFSLDRISKFDKNIEAT